MLKCKWTHLDITNEETLEDMVNTYTKEQDRIIVGGFDTETTGLHHIYDKPFLFQFGWCTNEFIGHTYTVDLELQPELARRVITIWHVFARLLPTYVGHNVKYDLHMLINEGLPYECDNVTDTMVWIRLGSDAIPERKGGAPLGLKNFAKRYLDISAKDMDTKLQEERTAIAKSLNKSLKQHLRWNKKQIDEFFKDKVHKIGRAHV